MTKRLWRAFKLAPVAVGLVVGACSLARRTGPSAPRVVAPSTPQGETAAPLVPLTSEPLDLETFTPLLALPEFHKARESLDAGEPLDAADRVRSVIAQRSWQGVERARAEFLLGRLEEEAARYPEAAAAYTAAAIPSWELTAYAYLGAGRSWLLSGDAAAAYAALDRVSEDGLAGTGRRPLLAEAASRVGNYERAVVLWRAEVAQAASPEAHLGLARALLASVKESGPGAADGELERSVRDILTQAQAAEIGVVPTAERARTARALQEEALALLPEGARAQLGARAPEVEVRHIEALQDAGLFDEAFEASEVLSKKLTERWSLPGCRLSFLRAKLLAQKRQWGRALDELTPALERCREDRDLRARLLFVAGKYAAADGRHAQAVRFFELLETEVPESSLADDSRLLRAQSYLRLGVEARFTELLSRMPEDYPEGDMTMEGVLELALRRIEKHDWPGAARVLERGVELLRGKDSARGHEHSGRERYFLARASYETGRREEALRQYADIIRELPLSYYMLHAYSRLVALDPERAQASLEEGLERATARPFSFTMLREYQRPEFQRGMELLRVGDIGRGRRELAALPKGDGAATDASLLWGIALLYGRAGAAGPSHGIARGQLTDWYAHWPAGDWRKPWELGFPRPYYAVVKREAAKNDIPEWLVYAIMREESAFDPAAESPAKAYGLMQLIVPTAKTYAQKLGLPYQPAALKRPTVNIALGSRFLSVLTQRFSHNPLLAIPGYNAGPGRPDRWLKERPDLDFDVWVELIPFRETRRYTKRVLASRAAYAFLYDAEQAETAMRLPLVLVGP